jgi:hypothetical protein
MMRLQDCELVHLDDPIRGVAAYLNLIYHLLPDAIPFYVKTTWLSHDTDDHDAQLLPVTRL